MIPRLFFLWLVAVTAAAAPIRPNIVFFLCDDLGYGDVGCFGQKLIRTPNIDRLALRGMKLTAHYSGHNVCAPSRCVLMSGLHPGHGFIRENVGGFGSEEEGQMPVPAGTLQLPLTLQTLGYRCGAFGKWGLGPVGSTGDPLNQGFHRFYGHNCQAVAHNYYPSHLWSDDQKVQLSNSAFAAHQKLPAGADANDPESYGRYSGKEYAPDLIAAEALKFVRENKDRPFFLYYPTTVPHLALQVPDDSLQEYAGKFPETPYQGGRGYLPHRTPRAAYAAMITRMDREFGRLMELLDDLKLTAHTIVIFTSDNGPLYDQLGGTDAEFFNSSGGFRGRKGSFYEGGFRVPCVIAWPGHITPGSICERVTGFEDWMPTLLELIGAKDATMPAIDGIGFAPSLRGEKQEPRPLLYRESPGYGGQACLRQGDWKLLGRNLHPPAKQKNPPPAAWELYNIATDPHETKDVSAEYPDIVKRLTALLRGQHVKSDRFPLRWLDGSPE